MLLHHRRAPGAGVFTAGDEGHRSVRRQRLNEKERKDRWMEERGGKEDERGKDHGLRN